MPSYIGAWEVIKLQFVPDLSNRATELEASARRKRWTSRHTVVPIDHRDRSSSGRIFFHVSGDVIGLLPRESRSIDKFIWEKGLSEPRVLDSQLPTAVCTRESWCAPDKGKRFQILCKEGQLDGALDVLVRMHQKGLVPPVKMLRGVLQACAERKALAQAKRIDAHLSENGFLANSFLVQCKEAVKMYQRMQEEGVQLNAHTFVSLLKACSSMGDLHEECNAAAYVQQGQPEKVLLLYEEMLQEGGVTPSNRTLVSMLQAYGFLAEKEETTLVAGQSTKLQCLQKVKGIHGFAQLKGYDTDVFEQLCSCTPKCGWKASCQMIAHLWLFFKHVGCLQTERNVLLGVCHVAN